jgi:protein O-mannosyl-transferase
VKKDSAQQAAKTSEKSVLEKSDLFTAVALLVVAVVPFLQVLDFDFVNYDDPDYVTANPTVTAGLTGKGVAWAFTSGHAGNWHPLTWISHMLDCSLFGVSAGPHHLTSVLLHGANAALLFVVLRLMTCEKWKSALVAALFALHPLHVESVAWIAERKDVLSGFFWLCTMLAYYRYCSRRTVVNYALLSACFAFGLMAKPMLVTLPFVLLLLDFWPLRRFAFQPTPAAAIAVPRKRGKGGKKAQSAQPMPTPAERDTSIPLKHLLLEKVPLIALAVASSAVTFAVQQRSGAVGSLGAWSFGMRVANAIAAYGIYLWELFVPVNLAVFYPLPGSPPWGAILLSLLGMAAMTAFSVWSAKRHPFLITGWLWYLGTLVPVIGLVQVGLQSHADRYTYLPSIGIFVMLVWGGEVLLERMRVSMRVATVSGAAALGALSLLAWRQVGFWQNSKTLFSHAVGVTTNNYVALNNLGQYFGDAGDFKKAIECYQQALEGSPNAAKVHFNLAHASEKVGDLNAAAKQYAEVLRVKPQYPIAHYNLAIVLAKLGRTADAMGEYAEELRVNPESSEAHNNLGTLLSKAGRWDEAIEHYGSAIRINSQSDSAYSNLAVTLLKKGRIADAVEACTAALRINPRSPDAHNNLGRALEGQGRTAEAIAHYQEALRMDSKFDMAQKNLRRLQQSAPNP